MHDDTFNADLYVTLATVIPVLYLALTLQGRTFERLLARHQRLHAVPFEQQDWRWNLLDVAFIAAAYIIALCTFTGEGCAIWVLYNRASDVFGVWVIACMFILLAAVVAGPIFGWLKMIGTVTPGDVDNQAKESDDPLQ